MKLSEIATLIGADFSGEDFEVKGMNTLIDASSDELSFVANAKYIKDISTSNAGAIIVDEKTKEFVPDGCSALVVESPYWQMAVVSAKFAPLLEEIDSPKATIGEGSRVSLKAEIANGASIGKNCQILAGVYVGSNVTVGDNTILYPNVTIYRDCKIGNECIIHAGTVIGSDGFGFASNKLGEHKKIYHNGNVVIEDDVEIGSNTSIDRAVFGTTLISRGSRLDNLIHIAHNCVVGEYSVLAGQTGLAGSSKLGRSSVFGAQSGVAGHLEIAPFNTFAARSGVTKSIKESGKVFAGFPFMDHKAWLKIQAKLARLIK
ncbi:UDP-3-O-(3-hydroxymyristoyl)glucosamine N-acyltransferase [Sulfurimonas aquatica]|uniref:UDP-3-O-acylglucosamine N-acyltransferase n=1 Tax=Sulfurimonas aquatica TaxID=2672570 RepID=A0A975B0G3_9BACT|nr:UDP-3-O-(3-hydroxymyristoyl)glucosamine N-acyltransferase [Sulfurimonas aquatica]QSZ41838.1 UDP-3-O-(3-hydroxymyristoyl)glucosamine N-acyltransferase [Sulfurimonas aquatica]